MTPRDSVPEELARVHRALVDALGMRGGEAVSKRFTVAEIYQDLIPYRTHRDLLGVAMNGDYEHLILRLLAGEGGLLVIESESAQEAFRLELQAAHPNTGIFREYAALDVMLEAASGAALDDPTQGALFEEQGASESHPGADVAGLADLAELADLTEVDDRPKTASLQEQTLPMTPPATAPSVGSGDRAEGACLWCDEVLPTRDDLRFCPFCGQDVRVLPCAQCAAPVEPGWRFCIACGHAADAGSA